MGDGARRGFEDFGVSVGRTAGFSFGFEGVGGVEVGLGIEEVTVVLALGRGMESEDITRGRDLLESMVDDGQVVGGEVLPKDTIEAIASGLGRVTDSSKEFATCHGHGKRAIICC